MTLSSTCGRLAAVGTLGAMLWTCPAFAIDAPGARPGDEAMTCEQIAAELAPFAQQIMPNLQAFGATQQQLYAQSRALGEKQKAEQMLLLPLIQAGAMDPTGASKRVYQAAAIAQRAKQRAESEALANSPLAQQGRAQGEQFAAQGQALQADTRIQRLMQVAQANGCDKH